MMSVRQFTRLLVLFGVLLSLGIGASAAVSCKVEEMVFCKDIHEWEHRYQPLDRTTTFSPEDQYVYCFLKIHAEKAVDVTVKWTTPSGELYHTHTYELEAPPRGYYTTWSLRPRLAINGVRAASLTGTWKVRISLSSGFGKTGEFDIVGQPSIELPPPPIFPTPSPVQPPPEEPIQGREEEPNDSLKSANLIEIDNLIQGGTYYHSPQLFDQDWFEIVLPLNQTYWVCVNYIGSRALFVQDATGDLKLSLPYEVFEEHDVDNPISGTIYHRYTTDYNTDTVDCMSAFEIRGPGVFHIRIFSELSDLVYSLRVMPTLPDWAR